MSIGCKHWAALISLHEYMSSTGHWAPRELMGAVMSAHVLPGATRPLSTWHQLQLHLWKAHWTCCIRNCLSCGLRDIHIAQKWERFQISQVTGQRTILPSTSHLCLLHQRDAHWLSWSLQVAWSLTNGTKLGNGQGHHWTPSVLHCKLCTGFNSITINQSAFLRVCAQFDHSVLHPLWISKVAVQIFKPSKSALKTQVRWENETWLLWSNR